MQASLLGFRCARAPRNRGIGWERTDEQSAASMRHSYRISECREVLRAQLLRDLSNSLTAVAGGGIFSSAYKSGCWTTFGDAERRRRRAPHGRTVRNCMFFRFLRSGSFRDCCRPREPGGNCLRSSVGIHRILVRRTATTHSVVGPHCCMGREMQRSRGKLCAVPSRKKYSPASDVSYTAAAFLPPSRRCRVNGALLDELLRVTGLAPLLPTTLRANPRVTLYATDASPSGAGRCVAPITQEAWLALHDLAEEKGEHVRLDWKGEEPPSNVHDGHAAAAPLALWATMFSHRCSEAIHINLLEPESLISLPGGSHVKEYLWERNRY